MRFRISVFVVFGSLIFSLGYVFAESAQKKVADMTPVERGKYLTVIAGCNDCHTPKTYNEKGMQIDLTRELSGHPADSKLPELPSNLIGPGKWTTVTMDLTAWYGPWGVSFTRNLTPDVETGLGSWTEDMFIKALRTGKHMGAADGRDILPPMPWQMYAQMTDEDLKAIWAYLRTIKAIKNAIPEPIPPAK
jgi:hypothetical protein